MDNKRKIISSAQLTEWLHTAIHLQCAPEHEFLLEARDEEIAIPSKSARIHKIYIEPTTACNLACKTCMRNAWSTSQGVMNPATFDRILDSVKQLSPLPSIFFGGYGEPLSHPHILKMIASLRDVGARVELITNGILLDEKMSQAMIELRVDRIWVSLDGARPESYGDVRVANELPRLLKNLQTLCTLRLRTGHQLPNLGIAFVAMKRNIADLQNVVDIGRKFGADHFSISHVLAHTHELSKEILYDNIYIESLPPSQYSPRIDLPRIPFSEQSGAFLQPFQNGYSSFTVGNQQINFGENHCPFIHRGSVSIRWDGKVSPCLPLLHHHQYYLENEIHQCYEHLVGDIATDSLSEIWQQSPYSEFRRKVLKFDFSPCVYCNSCDMAYDNLEDCFGSEFPACGKCLWAQGIIRCP
ncbi:radical SAM protein [Ornatilinea apprima]|uniref:radical SAM protein n=1 Tax=Ornatilinea apprima TaxID=1134406 RepID=UPI00094646F3|nr:radical SAM protein [Ornatilinea apprima]